MKNQSKKLLIRGSLVRAQEKEQNKVQQQCWTFLFLIVSEPIVVINL